MPEILLWLWLLLLALGGLFAVAWVVGSFVVALAYLALVPLIRTLYRKVKKPRPKGLG